MSDQKTTGNEGDGDTQNLPQLSSLSNIDDDYDPDEATDNHRCLTIESGNTSNSLSVLESDLRSLHAKWQDFETIISERDERIAVWERDLTIYRERCGLLEKEVETLSEEKQRLSVELDEQGAELQDMVLQYKELDAVASEREQELKKAQEDSASLAEDKRRLENEISGQSQQTADISKRIETMHAEENALRLQVQELNDYIDGRKSTWLELNDKLKEHEATINGLIHSVESRDKTIAAKESEKAKLSGQIAKLERDLAEVRGKYTEKDSSYRALQQSLEARAKELGNLGAESTRSSKDIERLQKKLKQREALIETLRGEILEGNDDSVSLKEQLSAERTTLVEFKSKLDAANNRNADLESSRKERDASIEALRSELKDSKDDRAMLKEQLSSEKATLAEFRSQLDAANSRIADLESSRRQREAGAEELSATVGALRERLKASDPTIQKHEATIADLQQTISDSRNIEKELRDDVAASSTRIEELVARTADQEILVAESNASSQESSKALLKVEEELNAQRERVHLLEAELVRKQEDLDLLDRSVSRLHAIGSEVRGLDMQIDDVRRRKPKPAALDLELPIEQTKSSLLNPQDMVDDKSDDNCAYEHLLIQQNDAGGQSNQQLIPQGVSTIGRASTNSIRIASKFISRLHARITVEDGSAFIEDAGSTNGFLVNSMQTRRHRLTSGDLLEIGDCKFRYICSRNGLDTSGLRNGQRDH
jgi:chromosome segregation ATPase